MKNNSMLSSLYIQSMMSLVVLIRYEKTNFFEEIKLKNKNFFQEINSRKKSLDLIELITDWLIRIRYKLRSTIDIPLLYTKTKWIMNK